MHRQQALAFLVADGARASLRLRHGDGRYDEVAVFANPARHRPRHDTRGRVFASGGETRSAIPADAEDGALKAFAAELAVAVERFMEGGRAHKLTLVAPARMLGALRAALPPQTLDRVSAALAKDLTKLPERELRQALEALVLPATSPAP
jgi:protein required for attachment to host cells